MTTMCDGLLALCQGFASLSFHQERAKLSFIGIYFLAYKQAEICTSVATQLVSLFSSITLQLVPFDFCCIWCCLAQFQGFSIEKTPQVAQHHCDLSCSATCHYSHNAHLTLGYLRSHLHLLITSKQPLNTLNQLMFESITVVAAMLSIFHFLNLYFVLNIVFVL